MQIGIDLGATKIESVLLDQRGKELYRQREKTPDSYDRTIEAIENIVNLIKKNLIKVLMLAYVILDQVFVTQV